MKISIRHQESYSRGELLLRSFFGMFYIVLPFYICMIFLGIGVLFAMLIAFFAILFTGSFPRGLFNFILNVMRWGFRVMARMLNLSDGYPAFGLNASDQNTVFDIPYNEKSNRLTVLLRFFLAPIIILPHGICLILMEIPVLLCVFAAWLIVLITGKYPKGIHNFVSGYFRWALRVGAYMYFLTDNYPPFTLSETDPVNWNEGKNIEDHLV